MKCFFPHLIMFLPRAKELTRLATATRTRRIVQLQAGTIQDPQRTRRRAQHVPLQAERAPRHAQDRTRLRLEGRGRTADCGRWGGREAARRARKEGLLGVIWFRRFEYPQSLWDGREFSIVRRYFAWNLSSSVHSPLETEVAFQEP